MTAPTAGLHTDAAADASALTVSVIKDQALGSFLTMGRLVGPIVVVGLVLAVLAACAWLARRVLHEVRLGRQTLDPRPLVDPTASDLLGEW